MNVEINGDKILVNALNVNQLDSELIRQWEDLEERSIEGNAYLSPFFVLPAIKYLTPNLKVVFIVVFTVCGNEKKMTGFGVFEYSCGSKQFPFPHLKAYRCKHSYLSGLLIDENFVDSTLHAFFKFVKNEKRYWCGIEFMKRTGDTELAKKMNNIAAQLSIPWHQYICKKRVILIPRMLTEEYNGKNFSGSKKKKYRRSRNQLLKSGEITWDFINGGKVEKECIDRFLQLEHMGWKGTTGSSLLSKSNEEAFFREMVTGFANDGRIFFTELMVNGLSISSTVNLISAKLGFAFKIGWDIKFADASPGILNELELMKNAAQLLPHLEYIDSGAEEGSYIEKLWHEDYALVSGIYITKSFISPIITFVDFTRRVKQQFELRKAV